MALDNIKSRIFELLQFLWLAKKKSQCDGSIYSITNILHNVTFYKREQVSNSELWQEINELKFNYSFIFIFF